MKKIFIILFCITVVTGIRAFGQKGVTFTTFKDASRGISMNYPSTWSQIKDSSIALGFMSPKAGNETHSDALVSIDIWPTEIEAAKTIISDYEKACNREFTDYKKLKSGSQKIGNYDCSKLFFEATPRDVKLAIMICVFVDNNIEYVFTCSSKPGTFKQNLTIFDKMIESFKTSQ